MATGSRRLSEEGTALFCKALLADAKTLECLMQRLGRTQAHGTIDMAFPDLMRRLEEASRGGDLGGLGDLGLLRECDIRCVIRRMKCCPNTSNVIMRVFELHATCGSADLQRVGSSLSSFCKGGGEDIQAAGLAVWDAGGHGCITKHSMRSYLCSVYMAEYDLKPWLPARLGIRADQLAQTTTDNAFKELGIADTITLEQFLHWRASGLRPAAQPSPPRPV